MKINIVIKLFIIIFLFSSEYSFAKLLVNPKITISETYNDNIFLEKNNSDKDFITSITPGFDLNYGAKELKLNLDYSLYFKKYNKYSEKNESKLRDVQRVKMDALVLPDRDLNLALVEEISRVVIDERDKSVEENDFANKTTLYHFTANPQYQWRKYPSFRAIFAYQYDNYDYVSGLGDNVETQRYRLALEKDLVTETTIKMNGSYKDYRSETKSNYNLEQVSGGLIHQVGPRWLIDAEGGIARVDFDTGQEVETSIWMTSVSGQVAKHLELLLATERAFIDSVNSGVSKRTQASATLHYVNVFDIEIKAQGQEDRYQTEYRNDRGSGVALKVGIPLSRKIILKLKADVWTYKFVPETEKVTRLGAGALVTYVGKQGSLSLGYTYRDSNSDIDSRDYVNNIAAVSASLRF